MPPPLRLGALLLPSRGVSQVRDLKRRSAAAATPAALAPAPSAADSSSDVPYIETLTQIFEHVAATFMQQEQLAMFIGGLLLLQTRFRLRKEQRCSRNWPFWMHS